MALPSLRDEAYEEQGSKGGTEEHNISSKIRMTYTHIYKNVTKFKFPTPKQQKKPDRKSKKNTQKHPQLLPISY